MRAASTLSVCDEPGDARERVGVAVLDVVDQQQRASRGAEARAEHLAARTAPRGGTPPGPPSPAKPTKYTLVWPRWLGAHALHRRGDARRLIVEEHLGLAADPHRSATRWCRPPPTGACRGSASASTQGEASSSSSASSAGAQRAAKPNAAPSTRSARQRQIEERQHAVASIGRARTSGRSLRQPEDAEHAGRDREHRDQQRARVGGRGSARAPRARRRASAEQQVARPAEERRRARAARARSACSLSSSAHTSEVQQRAAPPPGRS